MTALQSELQELRADKARLDAIEAWRRHGHVTIGCCIIGELPGVSLYLPDVEAFDAPTLRAAVDAAMRHIRPRFPSGA
jgi:hypothetical protein